MAGEYTLRTDDEPSPRSMVFELSQGKPAFTIWADGRVEIGSEVTPDEAGKRVFEIVTQMWGDAFRNAVREERESCAKLAEQSLFLDMGCNCIIYDIAAAIRARGKEGT